ncbi:hypothetical protein C1H46_001111 [Malus baccata]|uniref:Uncharacterized protein n=1 Tax=Malus baccata TaxID=106549 RepID=A0A540NQJ2_MALBA|nr:hypothetical protein C1H46_001111 [Malus baccata]
MYLTSSTEICGSAKCLSFVSTMAEQTMALKLNLCPNAAFTSVHHMFVKIPSELSASLPLWSHPRSSFGLLGLGYWRPQYRRKSSTAETINHSDKGWNRHWCVSGSTPGALCYNCEIHEIKVELVVGKTSGGRLVVLEEAMDELGEAEVGVDWLVRFMASERSKPFRKNSYESQAAEVDDVVGKLLSSSIELFEIAAYQIGGIRFSF